MRDYLSGFIGSRATINSRKWGRLTFEAAALTDAVDGDLVVRIGNPEKVDAPLVRIRSECVFAEAFDSDLCDCSDQLDLALLRMKQFGSGLLFYLRLDGRGVGLAAKVKATKLEVEGVDTYESRLNIGVPAECRDFSAVGRYLFENGFRKIRLLTNNPDKINQISQFSIAVVSESLYIQNPSKNVEELYRIKRERFGHKIPLMADKLQLRFDF